MSSKKTVIKNYISNMLILLLACLLMISATFAWFTDEETVERNVIRSGNLDVELEYSLDNENWKDATSTAKLFADHTFWEPTHMEVVYLRISNPGSLALKYKLTLNVLEEIASINVYGDLFNLSDYLLVGTLDHETMEQDETLEKLLSGDREFIEENSNIPFANMENILGNESAGLEDYLSAGESHVIGLIVRMPANVGNEVNYGTNTEPPVLKFGINVVAGQQTEEKDSFDDQYDKDAVYPMITKVDFLQAIEEGGIVVLGKDMTFTEPLTIDKEVTLDLNGHTLTIPGFEGVDGSTESTDSDLTIVGLGTLVLSDFGTTTQYDAE